MIQYLSVFTENTNRCDFLSRTRCGAYNGSSFTRFTIVFPIIVLVSLNRTQLAGRSSCYIVKASFPVYIFHSAQLLQLHYILRYYKGDNLFVRFFFGMILLDMRCSYSILDLVCNVQQDIVCKKQFLDSVCNIQRNIRCKNQILNLVLDIPQDISCKYRILNLVCNIQEGIECKNCILKLVYNIRRNIPGRKHILI